MPDVSSVQTKIDQVAATQVSNALGEARVRLVKGLRDMVEALNQKLSVDLRVDINGNMPTREILQFLIATDIVKVKTTIDDKFRVIDANELQEIIVRQTREQLTDTLVRFADTALEKAMDALQADPKEDDNEEKVDLPF